MSMHAGWMALRTLSSDQSVKNAKLNLRLLITIRMVNHFIDQSAIIVAKEEKQKDLYGILPGTVKN